MNIAILGTRGIPNKHGGFEQFAEYFSTFLVSKYHNVYVYNSHDHPYQKTSFKGVTIIHCYDPEFKIGTAGQFIYDFNCIMDARKRNFDVILQLGYTSNSIWHRLLPKKPLIITNMDGMEWKRSKYSNSVKRFLKYAEKLAVKSSDYLISDSLGIKTYIQDVYNKKSKFIAYGATVFKNPNSEVLKSFNLKPHNYGLLIARLEPENNIESIIEGFHKSNANYDLIIFGTLNVYGQKLKKTFAKDQRIRFLGANYDQEALNNLRYYSRYYFHGHSVGGTNPSLLEAMASSALIIANQNIYNKSVLQNDAVYFEVHNDIVQIINNDSYFEIKETLVNNNLKKIKEHYNWLKINSSYESFILNRLKEKYGRD